VKTYNDEGVYELSWEIHNSQKLFAANQLNYYTLYWCENDMNHPHQCNVRKLKIYILPPKNMLLALN